MLTAATNRTTNKDGVHVQVVVRCRPLNEKEESKSVQSVVHCSTKEVTVLDKAQNFKKYTFDRVFGPESSQAVVFDEAIRPFVENVLDGFNCTIFAYGQTGTGKTYTMGGESSLTLTQGEFPGEAGIIPRTVKRIFQKLQGSDSTVTVNFLELYNEELTDLLDPWSDQVDKDGNKKKKIMKIMEDHLNEPGVKLRRGIMLNPYPEDCVVTNESEILQILEKGSAQRQTAETLLNDKSSRSHSIFVITIQMKETKSNGEDVIKVGKLNLVDLAGSENVSRAGSNRKEERQREAGSINQSLLTLGRVINALVDKSSHVPYRDSNLTRLLRDSLGGSTKTLMIATISPGEASQEETYKTLDYANRAKSIKNRPEVNQRIAKTDLVKDLHAEIKKLKEELVHQRQKEGVVVVPLEKHAQNEADRKAMLQEIDRSRDEVKDLQFKITEANSEAQKLKEMQDRSALELHKKEQLLKEHQIKLQDQTYWSETYQKNCEELNHQLQNQSGNIESLMKSLRSCRSVLDQFKEKVQQNEGICKESVEIVKSQVDQISQSMDQTISEFLSKAESCTLLFGDRRRAKKEKKNFDVGKIVEEMGTLHQDYTEEMSNLLPLSLQTLNEEKTRTQSQYKVLKETAEDVIAKGFDRFQRKAMDSQKQWSEDQEILLQEQQTRTNQMRIEKKRLLDKKRKLQCLREEAEETEEQSFKMMQEQVQSIVQDSISRCLEDVLPKIYNTTKAAMQSKISMLGNCTDMVQDLEQVIEELSKEKEVSEGLKPDLVGECQTARKAALEELSAVLGKLSKDANPSESLQLVSHLKDRHDDTQRTLAKTMEMLRDQIGIESHHQKDDMQVLEEQWNSIASMTAQLGEQNSAQLQSLKEKYLELTCRLNWELPQPGSSKKSITVVEEALSEKSNDVEGDQETASSVTVSSGACKNGSSHKKDRTASKENHSVKDDSNCQQRRPIRKAKRKAKTTTSKGSSVVLKGPNNLNSGN